MSLHHVKASKKPRQAMSPLGCYSRKTGSSLTSKFLTLIQNAQTMKKTDAAQFANKALKKAIWSKFYPAGTYSTSSASTTG